MKRSFQNLVLFSLTGSMLSLAAACGKDSDSDNSGRTMVVEVGDGQPGLRLADETPPVEGDGSVSSAEIQQCAGVFEGQVEGWKVSGSQNNVSLSPTQAFATKITGNENSLNLIIKAKEGETSLVAFPGLCLVLAGNQPNVNVTLNAVTVTTFKVIANGNKGTVNITLEKGAVLPAGATDDLGKHVTVTVVDNSAK
jgi:hypothetical protein